jgi:uncharacterized membrane protein
LLLFLFSFSVLFSQSDNEIFKKNMQTEYIDFLRSEGYVGKVDSDGDIEFKFEGKKYFIAVSDVSDDLYFNLECYLINEKEGCSNRVIKALKKTDGYYKTVRLKSIGTDCRLIKIFSSSFLARPDDYKLIFERSLGILVSGKKEFLSNYDSSPK